MWGIKVGEWSEYFEDFPEENPANRKSRGPDLGPMSEFFPQWHISQLTKAELAEIDEKIRLQNVEAERLANEHAEFVEKAKKSPLLFVEACPRCNAREMNVHKISDNSYFCECQFCGITGSGISSNIILEKIADAVWGENNY